METLYDAYCTAQRSGAALVAHVRRQGLKKHQIARDFRITQKEADLYIWLGHQFTAKLLMLAAEKQLSVSQLQVVAKAANKASANLVDKQALRQEFINHAATCTVDELHLYVNTRVLEVNSGRAPRKAATGISKQADADGMGHIHAAMPYHEAKKVSAILDTDAKKLRRLNPNLGYAEALTHALINRVTAPSADSSPTNTPCFLFPLQADATYFADGTVAFTNGSTRPLKELVDEQLSDYGYVIVTALDENGVPTVATSYLCRRSNPDGDGRDKQRSFSPWQKFISTAEYLCCMHPDCSYPAISSQGHHLKAWTNGGPTTLTNCVPLCGPHNAQNDDNPAKHWHNGHAIKDPATGRVGWQFTRGGPIYHNKNPLIRKGMREWALAYYGFISMTPTNK